MDAFSIFHVTTELQRKLLPEPTPDLFVFVNTEEAVKDGKIDWSALKPRELGEHLSADLKTGKTKLHFHLFWPRSVWEGGLKDNEQVLRLALCGFGHEIGYTTVTSNATVRNDQVTWDQFRSSFTGKNSVQVPGDEPALGNDLVQVYPVCTDLSRCLADGADCVVHVLVSLKKDKGAIPQKVRDAIINAVTKLKLTQKNQINFRNSHAVFRDDQQKALGEFDDIARTLGFKGNSVSLNAD